MAQKRPDRWLSNTGTMAHFEQIIHDWITDLMISCVLSYVMHLDPQLVREEVKTEAQLLLWGNVVVAIREYSATRYSGSSLPTLLLGLLDTYLFGVADGFSYSLLRTLLYAIQ